jgi:impB/mucB/samB family
MTNTQATEQGLLGTAQALLDPLGEHEPSPGLNDGVSRSVLHLDMDTFFAAVEQQDRPTLAGRPVLVGGVGPRGVVAGASYEARAYGARSAMPMSQARRQCPSAVVLPPRLRVYQAVSARVFSVVRQVGGPLEQVALDEALPSRRRCRELMRPQSRSSPRGCGSGCAATPGWWPRWVPGRASRSRRSGCGSCRRVGSGRCWHRCRYARLWGVGPAADRTSEDHRHMSV